jgi:hypothetical protein
MAHGLSPQYGRNPAPRAQAVHPEAASLFPELFERTRTQLAVVGRVLNIDVAEPQLKPPRVVPGIRQ